MDAGDELLQVRFAADPWRIFVSCILLNNTSRVNVDKVIDNLFTFYPSARMMAEADPQDVARIIRPTGLQNVKAHRLVTMSQAYIGMHKRYGWGLEEGALPGVGPYGWDSYYTFHLGKPQNLSGDKEIAKYLEDSLLATDQHEELSG